MVGILVPMVPLRKILSFLCFPIAAKLVSLAEQLQTSQSQGSCLKRMKSLNELDLRNIGRNACHTESCYSP